jgi:hypothetical protein
LLLALRGRSAPEVPETVRLTPAGLHEVQRAAEAVEVPVRDHLWVTPDFEAPATASLEGTAAQVAALRARVEKLRQGFSLLPKEGDPPTSSAPARAPASSPAIKPQLRKK